MEYEILKQVGEKVMVECEVSQIDVTSDHTGVAIVGFLNKDIILSMNYAIKLGIIKEAHSIEVGQRYKGSSSNYERVILAVVGNDIMYSGKGGREDTYLNKRNSRIFNEENLIVSDEHE